MEGCVQQLAANGGIFGGALDLEDALDEGLCRFGSKALDRHHSLREVRELAWVGAQPTVELGGEAALAIGVEQGETSTPDPRDFFDRAAQGMDGRSSCGNAPPWCAAPWEGSGAKIGSDQFRLPFVFFFLGHFALTFGEVSKILPFWPSSLIVSPWALAEAGAHFDQAALAAEEFEAEAWRPGRRGPLRRCCGARP